MSFKTTTRDFDPERVICVYQSRPGEDQTPPGRSWRTRVRGDVGGMIDHEYRCPVHGVFRETVMRSSVPDDMLCVWIGAGHEACSERAPWAGAACGIGHAAGEVTS